MISKACVVGAYQRKLEELAAQESMELLVVVPPYWQEEVRQITLEPLHTRGYRLEVEPIRFNGKFHFFYFPGLGRRIQDFHPDLVHIDEEPYNFASVHALWLARRCGARTLFFTWQNLYRRYPPPFSWMERYCFNGVDRAIAGNVEAVEVLRRKGFGKPVEVIPQFGVDPEIFAPPPLLLGEGRGEGVGTNCPSPTLTRPSGGLFERGRPNPTSEGAPFRVGFVGRLVEQKGIADAIEAVASMGTDARLVLIGAGPMKAEIEQRAAALGMAGRLEIVPGVPSKEMPAIYNGLDVLVLPSRTRPNWKEQFGRALVEAMACEVPVVGSDSGEIPNVIGDAGLVFPEGDVAALTGHLRRLQDSQDMRRDLGRRGRARVLDRFTQARVAEQTYQLYRQILG